MGRDKEYAEYENRLLDGYRALSEAMQALYVLALEDGDFGRARMLAEKKSALARVFDMGAYHEAAAGLELAVAEKDADRTADVLRRMLDGAETIGGFCRSPLYEHLSLREPDGAYAAALRADLLEGLRDEETYGFLRDDERWKELTGA